MSLPIKVRSRAVRICAVRVLCCAVRLLCCTHLWSSESLTRSTAHHAYAGIQYVSSDDVIKVPSVQKWAPPQFKHRAIFLNDEELLGVYLQLRTRQDRRRRWLLPVRVHTRALSGVQMILHSHSRQHWPPASLSSQQRLSRQC